MVKLLQEKALLVQVGRELTVKLFMLALVLIESDHLRDLEAHREFRITDTVFKLGHKQGLHMMNAFHLTFAGLQPLAFARLADDHLLALGLQGCGVHASGMPLTRKNGWASLQLLGGHVIQ